MIRKLERRKVEYSLLFLVPVFTVRKFVTQFSMVENSYNLLTNKHYYIE